MKKLSNRTTGSLYDRFRAGHKAVADLGRLELQGVDLIDLMRRAVEMVANILNAPFCEALELLPDDRYLLLQAGIGWDKEMIGTARIDVTETSQIGHSLLFDEPVITFDLEGEGRFTETVLSPKNARMASSITAPIGNRSNPFGVLGAHAVEHYAFIYEDLSFLQSVANILAAGFERQRSSEALKVVTWRMRNVLDNPDRVFFSVDMVSNTMLHVSLACEDLYGVPQQTFFRNSKLWREAVYPDDRAMHEAQVAQLYMGKALSLQHRILRSDGDIRWVQSKIEPTLGADGKLKRLDAVVSDITKRIQVEQALRSSEQDYQQLFDNINEVCFIIDREWRYKHLNRAASKITRIGVDSLVGQYVAIAFPGIEDTEQYQAYKQAMETGQPQQFTSSHILPGGTPDIFEVFVYPIPTGILCVAQDTADRDRAEAAERERRALAEVLRDTAEALNSILDFEEVLDRILANIRRVVPSEAAYVLLIEEGIARVVRSREYVLDQRAASDLLPLRFQVVEVPFMRRIAETSQPLVISNTDEEPDWAGDAPIAWIRSCACAPIQSEGKVIGFILLASVASGFFDIAQADRLKIFADQAAVAIKNSRLYENERRERILAQTLRKTAEALASSASLDEKLGLIIVHLGEVIRYDWAAVFAIEAEQLRLAALNGFPDPNNLLGRISHASSMPIVREAIIMEGPLLIPDVREDAQWVELPGLSSPTHAWIGIPLIAKDDVLGFLSIGSYHRDAYGTNDLEVAVAFGNQATLAIEKASMMVQLQSSLSDLHEAKVHLERTARLSAAGEVAAGVAHQINNPLTAVIAQTHLLQKKLSADHPGYKSVVVIQDAALRAANVVQRLLNLSRTQAYEMQSIDVNLSLKNSISLVNAQSELDVARFVSELADDLPPIQASQPHLEDAWINLLINARDAVGRMKDGSIKVSSKLLPQNGMIEIRIQDNGPGISQENLERLFNPFFTTKLHGTGLGLSICHEIITRHGGTIEAESKVGEGTTFVVILPVDGDWGIGGSV
ncbi:MAG: GAF domain-containing protein [Anaerolineae bacterium]|nr:GAF domain-containing protein [Anaerolineae bacterium]